MAKMIKFNLTLSGATVSTFDELQDNFSAEILPIYRSGRLLKWLQARELTEQVQAVQAMATSEDDSEQLGALCRALGLDDDAEVITFLLEDWQASQERQAAAQAAPTPQANTSVQSTEAEEEDAGDGAPAAEPVDWSGQDMSGRNFEGADLRNGIFKETNFEGCNFRGADLKGANFTGAYLSKCSLSNVDCTGADFTNANLSDAYAFSGNFNKAKFINSRIDGASRGKFIKCNFDEAQISTTIGSTMFGCSFIDANLKGVKFSEWLTGSDFNNADLSFTEFERWSVSKSLDSDFTKYSVNIFDVELVPNMANAINFSGSKLLGCKGLGKERADLLTAEYEKLKTNTK